MKTVAIILAGGSGKRFSKEKVKQFVKIKGRPLLSYTIEKFQLSPYIDEISIVSSKATFQDVKNIIESGKYTKVKHIIEGGTERFNSVYNALEKYKTSCVKIFIHDGVRPLISEKIIKKCFETLDKVKACVVVVPTVDTIYEVKDGIIKNIPDRNMLYHAQTPQCFYSDIICEAYNLAMENEDKSFFDDVGVLKKYFPNIDIKMVEGEYENIKLTYKKDLLYFNALLK